jgi:hypothetical protein
MPFSEQVNNAIINHWTGIGTWTQPVAVYVGVSTTTPAADGTSGVTEPTGGAYARVQVTTANWGAVSGGAVASDEDVVFVQATADWNGGSNQTHAVFYDAVTAGNFIGFKALQDAKPVISGDTLKILSGDLTLTMGGTA